MESFSLGWNWNPVIFFIVLVVSSVLAATVLKKRQVAWVVPALVLYFGLEWALPYSWLFKTIFWIAVLVAVVTAFRPGVTKFAKVPVGLVLVGLVIAALGSGVNRISGDDKSPDTKATASTCPAEYVQWGDTSGGAGAKQDQGFEAAFDAATKGKKGEALEKAIENVKIERTGHLGRTLAAKAHQMGLYKDPNNWKPLIKGKCLSETGQDLHKQYKGVLHASGTTTEVVDKPPAKARSTAVIDGKYTVSRAYGALHKKTIKTTLPDGTVIYETVWCFNNLVVGEIPPGIPTTPRVPDTPKVCPSGQVRNQNGVCVTPKSSNPNDYTYPSGKPPVTANPTPDSSPPTVDSTQTGGGGVIDSPTSSPGSETGGTAPGSTPPPPTYTPPPPNEGGTNDGTVTPP